MTKVQQLISAMVADEQHRDLYLHNAYFHAAIEQAAQFVIPALVAGFAVDAEARQAEIDIATERLKTMQPTRPIAPSR